MVPIGDKMKYNNEKERLLDEALAKKILELDPFQNPPEQNEFERDNMIQTEWVREWNNKKK